MSENNENYYQPPRARRLKDLAYQTNNNIQRGVFANTAKKVFSDITGKINNRPRPNVSNVTEKEDGTPVQICFDFTKGRCNRRNCKFSHDINEIIRYNSKEQGICFDFLRGECHRGPLCRFSHDLSKVFTQWMNELNVPNQRQTPNGICYDFVRGQCPRGKCCKFSHDLREIALVTSRQTMENLSNSLNKNNSGLISACWEVESNDCCQQQTAAPSVSGSSFDLRCDLERIDSVSLKKKESTNFQSVIKAVPEISQKTLCLKQRERGLSNIRVRYLLGNDLCQLIGLPVLKSVM